MTSPLSTRAGLTPGRVLILVAVLALVLAAVAFPRLERHYQLQAGLREQDTLRLVVEGLAGALRRYEPLPALIAERPILRDLLRNPDDPELVRQVNESFRQTAFQLKASDVYLMDTSGLTLAASSYRKELSFVGRNFSYRPYFTQALEGGIGRYFALGTTSGERGYFFAAPVEDARRIVGIVAVKFTVDAFEEAWRGSAKRVLVRDLKDIVFMASRQDWHFRTLRPLSETELAEVEVFRQYPLDRLRPLPSTTEPLGDELKLVSLEEEDTGWTRYVAGSLYIPDAGWNVTLLIPTAQARVQAVAVSSIMVLALLLIGLGVAFSLQRRTQLLERIEVQRAAREQLEERVIARTADLNHANAKLVTEVEERKAAEIRLRRTQAELVQAGKLAALGQMSAALSHEFNQPLAAVKSYADNAITFLERGRSAEARENVGRISQMADRMAEISRHLRNFARRPQGRLLPVSLDAVIQDALALLQTRLSSLGARVEVDLPDKDARAIGGHVRLQQVLVNLLNNALDAVEDRDDRRILLSVSPTAQGWRITVRDHGPGIAEDVLARLFDPFFTTKSPGKGLGLGLSISYNIVKDFGGHLAARNHPEGGAVLQVTLQRAEDGAEPAQPDAAAQETAAE
ncbi:ATP-binding protein [Stappia sp.]|uniref:ATP-binding protein n=1 Tax=Stappia sp. TaxID=1870903 RepID=UPI0032D8BF48